MFASTSPIVIGGQESAAAPTGKAKSMGQNGMCGWTIRKAVRGGRKADSQNSAVFKTLCAGSSRVRHRGANAVVARSKWMKECDSGWSQGWIFVGSGSSGSPITDSVGLGGVGGKANGSRVGGVVSSGQRRAIRSFQEMSSRWTAVMSA